METAVVLESQLWSVLDVQRFFPLSFLTCVFWYDVAVHELAIGKSTPQEFLSEARENIEGIRDAAKKSGMADIADRAEGIISRWMDETEHGEIATIGSVKTLMAELIRSIQERFSADLYFRIEPRDRPFYDKILLTSGAETAFPSSIRDVIEAGRCFALERWTACVMHLMRALEFPIKALVKSLNFSPSSPNWELVLNETEREIRKISPATHGPNWKQDEQFYSEAALHFRFIKNAWRNHAIHGHDTYDRHEAYEVLTHVRSFMDGLAVRLKE
jgi:hypothetical protein